MSTEEVNVELKTTGLKEWRISSSEDSSMAKAVVLFAAANIIQILSPEQYKDGSRHIQEEDPET